MGVIAGVAGMIAGITGMIAGITGTIAGIAGVIVGTAGVIAIAGVAMVVIIGMGPAVGRGSAAVDATTTRALPCPRRRGGILGMVKI